MALLQTEIVCKLLSKYFDDVEIIKVVTKGDQIKSPLYKVGGKGLFVKEIEDFLLTDKADIAVHSLKDIPAYFSEDLIIPCFLKREDPRDVFLAEKYNSILDVKDGGVIGTCAPRRKAQLPKQLQALDLRGNVDSRIKKLQNFDGIILSAAGLKRLNLSHLITEYLNFDKFVPAVGQGVICVQCRKNDTHMVEVLKKINDKNTEICITAERAFLKEINGDCTTPLGAFAQLHENLNINYFLSTKNGNFYKSKYKVPVNQSVQMSIKTAQELMLSSQYI